MSFPTNGSLAKLNTNTLVFSFLLLGCGEVTPPPTISGISASLNGDIKTIVNVSWHTNQVTTAIVHYGLDGDLSLSTPASDLTADQVFVPLLGLPAEREISYQITATTESGEEISSEVQVANTGSLPESMPNFSTTGDTMGAYSVLTLIGEFTGPVILNPEGEVVWYYRDHRHLDTLRAHLSLDGQSVLYNAAEISGEGKEEPHIIRVALDGSSEEAIPVDLLAHDFVEHADGTIGTIAAYFDAKDGPRADSIVEIHPDGTQSTLWTVYDCFDPITHPGDDSFKDLGWTWANAMDYSAAEDAYYVSLHNLGSIIRVDRATGTCDWGIGGSTGTIEITSGTPFMGQHQFDIVDDNIVIFDNMGAGFESRVVEYAIDDAAGTAEEVWEYMADSGRFVLILGDAHRFDDGDTLVTWSLDGVIERVNPAGDVTWDVHVDDGIFGFNSVVDTLYP